MSQSNAEQKTVVATFDKLADKFGLTPEAMFDMVADEYGESADESPEAVAESVMPDTSDETDESTDETEESEGVTCGLCGAGPFKNEHGLKTHAGRKHDGETEVSEPETADSEDITDEELLEAGVQEKNLEAVREYRAKNGVCKVEGCVYGCNDDSDYCAHQDHGPEGSEGSDETEESDGLTVANVQSMFGVNPETARKAIENYENGMFGSVKEAIEA